MKETEIQIGYLFILHKSSFFFHSIFIACFYVMLANGLIYVWMHYKPRFSKAFSRRALMHASGRGAEKTP